MERRPAAPPAREEAGAADAPAAAPPTAVTSAAAADASRLVYVGGLDEGVTKETLVAAFLPFGPLKDAQIPLDNATGRSRGFGFVEFEDAEDAAAAIANMDGAEMFGRTLRVNAARPARVKGRAVWADAEEWYANLREDGGGEGEGAAR
jgi:peptidyl-prolyl isomerase E (cyclophilin E)